MDNKKICLSLHYNEDNNFKVNKGNIKVNKYSGNCNNINNLYAKLCIPDIIRKINVKVFNLTSKINEARQILWHKTCK